VNKGKKTARHVFPSVMMTSTDEPPNAGPVPLTWPSLAFHPLGLYDLRRHLGKLPKEPGIYNTYIDHFKYSDLAWFAPGLSKKSSVETNRNSFLPEYLALRSTLPKNSTATQQRTALRKQLQALTFDCVCHFHRFCNVTHSLILLGVSLGQSFWWDDFGCPR
jgi:hypothetical protein